MPFLLLAQAADAPPKDPTPIYVWGGIVMGGVLLLILAIVAIRKKFFPPEEKVDATPAGFGVGQLKELYDQGLLSDDEFNAAKSKIVAESHAAFMAQGKSKDGKKK